MDRELESLVARAAGPPPADGPDLAEVRRRASRRERRRRLAAAGAVAAAALLAVPAWQALRPTPDVLVVDEPGDVARPALAPFDPADDVTADVATDLAPAQLDLQPTRLPADTQRCAGPAAGPDGATTSTTYCGPHGPITLTTGPHPTLEETGQPVRVGARTGWLDRLADGRWQLTLSDRDSMDDLHVRLVVPGAWTPTSVVGVLRSIPAVQASIG